MEEQNVTTKNKGGRPKKAVKKTSSWQLNARSTSAR